jgi:hypothetical protein
MLQRSISTPKVAGASFATKRTLHAEAAASAKAVGTDET